MKRNRTVIVLGIIVAITPFLGFPSGFKTFLYVSLGLIISLLTYLSLREYGYTRPQVYKREASLKNLLKEEADEQPQASAEIADNSHEAL